MITQTVKRFTRVLSAVLLLNLATTSVFAWNALGHMVIADVAYQSMSPDIREKVDKIVPNLNQEYPLMKNFINIAYWPDSIRSQRIETFTHWHYIDNPIRIDGTRIPRSSLVDTDNAVWAVNTIKMVVRNSKANPYDRARFLSFMTHIVGDLHQPLHTVTLVSSEHPKGDKGGNLYMVRQGKSKVKMHKLWDGGLGLFTGNSTEEHAKTIANELMAAYPPEYFGDRVNELNPEVWADEGMTNAKEHVYNTPEYQPVSDEYLAQGKELAGQSAVIAGYRLANLLTSLLKD